MRPTQSTPASMTTWSRPIVALTLAVGAVSLGGFAAPSVHAQEPTRLNKVIEALEAGEPARLERESSPRGEDSAVE